MPAPLQSLQIPVIRGLTDYPEHAQPGEAEICYNIDLSSHSGLTRGGVAFHGSSTNRAVQIGANTQPYPTGLWHFRSKRGALYEIRGIADEDGRGQLRANFGIGGDLSHSFDLPGFGLDHLAKWQGVEFVDRFVVATAYNQDDNNRTLYSFSPNQGFTALPAIDRTVSPLHGSAMFWGVDGDDEGPYLDKPPKATLLTSMNGRLYAAGLHEERDALRYSNFLDPEGWPGNNIIRVKTKDGAAITGLGSIANNLVVFKERSIHMGWVKSQYDANMRKVVDGVGCINADTIENVGDSLIFLGEDGVYLFGGSGITPLSQKIEKRLRALKPVFSMACAGYYRKKAQYWIAFPSGRYYNGKISDLVFVYDLRRKEWAEYRFNATSSDGDAVSIAVPHAGFGAFSSVLSRGGSEHFIGAGLSGENLFPEQAHFVRYFRFDAQEKDDGIDYDGSEAQMRVESSWQSASIVLGEHPCRRFDSLRAVLAGIHSERTHVWWLLDSESRLDAERYDQSADIDGEGDYQPRRVTNFGALDVFDSALWSNPDPYSDKLLLHGAQGRTIRIGLETKHKHGLDIRSLQLDTRTLSKW